LDDPLLARDVRQWAARPPRKTLAYSPEQTQIDVSLKPMPLRSQTASARALAVVESATGAGRLELQRRQRGCCPRFPTRALYRLPGQIARLTGPSGICARSGRPHRPQMRFARSMGMRRGGDAGLVGELLPPPCRKGFSRAAVLPLNDLIFSTMPRICTRPAEHFQPLARAIESD